MGATDAQKCRSKKITTDDLKKYKKILQLTNAHLTSYQPGGDIQITRGAKYREIIAPPLLTYQAQSCGDRVTSPVGTVLKKIGL